MEHATATRIAFVCDAGVDEERRQNFDIWVMDMARPERPVQITTNGSHDDHPQWDPTGNAIYFRSNRGGEWAIWKVESCDEVSADVAGSRRLYGVFVAGSVSDHFRRRRAAFSSFAARIARIARQSSSQLISAPTSSTSASR